VVGVGCVAALASVPPKRGDHRAFVAAHTREGGTVTWALHLAKGRRSRADEDALCARLVLAALAHGMDPSSGGGDGLAREAEALVTEALGDGDGLEREESPFVGDSAVEAGLAAVLSGEVDVVEVAGDEVLVGRTRRRLFLPGSFNPLHAGHIRLLQAAGGVLAGDLAGEAVQGPEGPGRVLDTLAAFELSILNADKPSLSIEELRRRVAQFRALNLPVVLTRAPLFADKARLLPPGSAFAVGYDTAVRLVDARFYGGSEGRVDAALGGMLARGVRFLVGGRVSKDDGRYRGLESMGLAEHRAPLFTAIPEDAFRVDLSSTAIRDGHAKPGLAEVFSDPKRS